MLQSYFRPIPLPPEFEYRYIGVCLLYIFGSRSGNCATLPQHLSLGGGIGHSKPLLVDPPLGGVLDAPLPDGKGLRQFAKACKSSQKLINACESLKKLAKSLEMLAKAYMAYKS